MASKLDGCITALTKLANKAFTRQEAQALVTKLQDAANRVKGAKQDVKLFSLRQAAGEFAEASITAAKARKVRLALDNMTTLDFRDLQNREYQDKPADALMAQLVGNESLKEGGHTGAQQMQRAAIKLIIDPMFNEMLGIKAQDGTHTAIELATSKQLDRPFVHVLTQISDPTHVIPDAVKSSPLFPVAEQVAKSYRKTEDLQKNIMLAKGINIVDKKGYSIAQEHNDRFMLQDRDKYIEIAKNRFHPDTYQGKDPDTFLKSFVDAVSSGIRLSHEGKAGDAFQRYAGSMAEQMAAERLVKFKSPDDMLAYRAETGLNGGAFNAGVSNLSRNAAKLALMDKLTADPLGWFNREYSRLEALYRTDTPNKIALQKSYQPMLNRLKVLTGYTAKDINPNASIITDTIKTYVAACTQPLSLLTSLPDVGQSVMYLNHWGVGTMDALGEFATTWARHFGIEGGEASQEGNRNTFYAVEEFQFRHSSNFRDGSGLQGMNRTVLTKLYSGNMQTTWDADLQWATQHLVSRQMGFMSDKPLADIKSKQFLNSLLKYGIDSNTWDTLRQGVDNLTKTGEHKYLTAEGVQNLPQASIISYLQKQGKTPTEYAITRARNELAMKVSTIFSDAGDHAITLAGANEQAIMNQGNQKGTLPRGFLDIVMHFKGYILASSYRSTASMVYGRGANSVWEALQNKNGEVAAAIAPIALGMAAWYIGDSAKALLNGQTPRTPDLRNPMSGANMRNALTALAGSGGLGPYADIVTHDFGSDSGQLVGLLAGPTAGRISKAAYLTYKSTVDQASGAMEGERKPFPGAADIDFASHNVPILSAAPIRTIANYAILDRIENMINPNYLSQKQKRIEKDSGQTNIFPTQ